MISLQLNDGFKVFQTQCSCIKVHVVVLWKCRKNNWIIIAWSRCSKYPGEFFFNSFSLGMAAVGQRSYSHRRPFLQGDSSHLIVISNVTLPQSFCLQRQVYKHVDKVCLECQAIKVPVIGTRS